MAHDPLRPAAAPAPETVDAIVLCGGQGTRLRGALGALPKTLAPVAGRPFLDWLIEALVGQGLGRIVLCTGHASEAIRAHVEHRSDARFLISEESEPLGTGGALIHALELARSDTVLVLNGDSWCNTVFAELLETHTRARAALTLVAVARDERSDAGALDIGPDGRVLRFVEKPPDAAGSAYVNAGIYAAGRRDLLGYAPARAAFSLERELIPALIARSACYAMRVDGPLIDIGTPERLRAAQTALARTFTTGRSPADLDAPADAPGTTPKSW